MLKTRNIDKINSVSLYAKQMSTELKNNEIDLMNKVLKIKEYYQGKEVDKVVTRMEDAVRKLDNISEDINYYGDYLEKITGGDKYNLGIYYKRLSNINNDEIKGIGGE
ncbi:MAG: hypothetical protein IJ068_01815 [Bacilli bacterium]|nr:hypothetical protein [Bacilli bacterium]